MDRMIPLCHKCAFVVTMPIPDCKFGGRTMIGCKLEPRIADYDAAKELCPDIKEKEENDAP